MRALVYHFSHDVKVDSVPDPILQEADDVILKVTATAICGSDLHLYRGKALRQCIAAVRRGGIVSVPGVYAGFIHGFLFGDVFEKGVTFKTGQTHVQKYMPELLEFIEAGKLSPEIIICTGFRWSRRRRDTGCSTRKRTTAGKWC